MSKLTLGSLFDGSGGFPLGAVINDITPIWASEIEPFPIRVTTKRLPFVKHYGDIRKINGAEIEPVDIITFGSPCTDMSVAGKRAGLDGKQSALFYEAIRIIKEMRCKTNGKCPRYAVWENVPGAFSSGKGKDFRAVLNEIAKVKDETLDVPMPDKDKWLCAGEIMGDDFSIAWRTIDAQFWGVAQRRRRIYLVADFADKCAGKILFEFESLSGYSPKSIKPWQTTARDAEGCVGTPISFEPGAASRLGNHYWQNSACTLRADMGDNQLAVAIENHPADNRIKIDESGTIQTLTSRMGTGGGNVPLVMNERQDALTIEEDKANTLTGTDYKGTQCVFEPNCDLKPVTLKIRCGCEGGGKGALVQADKSATLSCNNEQTVFVPFCKGKSNEQVVKTYGICSDKSNSMLSNNPNSGIYEADTSRTLDATGGNPSCNQGGIAVVALQGSMIGRADKNGPQGNGINEDICFSLNTIDHHAVAYAMTTGCYSEINKEIAAPLMARDYKDAPIVTQPSYGIDRAAFN
ncbi:DNA (cytosine-5)-methyltransferase 1 [Ruminiclostridium sufflavum DSM 19573]|uniref:DNA (Cytosine-5)-methyltransferase 1 n=1 Tax=Ruminiclostridium sufflavum DSM 19573 TaxID=1121337 RepID=A0A318XFY8_9FIRM|nr:DNA cytosine methyltransferase [Ruminiclostridium sufflavum]PYG84791.1 DNA (cytosine-5)-methyltransferase 1 [Ruminiclostridium sufflavum DSM 19573]